MAIDALPYLVFGADGVWLVSAGMAVGTQLSLAARNSMCAPLLLSGRHSTLKLAVVPEKHYHSLHHARYFRVACEVHLSFPDQFTANLSD